MTRPCLCGHWEDRHGIYGCEHPECVCDGFIRDDDDLERATEAMLDRLRGK